MLRAWGIEVWVFFLGRLGGVGWVGGDGGGGGSGSGISFLGVEFGFGQGLVRD